jgi:hypothetical protein
MTLRFCAPEEPEDRCTKEKAALGLAEGARDESTKVLVPCRARAGSESQWWRQAHGRRTRAALVDNGGRQNSRARSSKTRALAFEHVQVLAEGMSDCVQQNHRSPYTASDFVRSRGIDIFPHLASIEAIANSNDDVNQKRCVIFFFRSCE